MAAAAFTFFGLGRGGCALLVAAHSASAFFANSAFEGPELPHPARTATAPSAARPSVVLLSLMPRCRVACADDGGLGDDLLPGDGRGDHGARPGDVLVRPLGEPLRAHRRAIAPGGPATGARPVPARGPTGARHFRRTGLRRERRHRAHGAGGRGLLHGHPP